ncbi:hypothetical protein FRB96_005337 [Tulasnella sp. 330]|nr:hypothetical protein FRB96_005337 [Tulasnella sp. 330]KAG8869865.1 hypothetical protein FRB97_000648 [Tulasnella sp. 331]KAG8874882.1 hypothetical protein FRB98_008192 [Tulasnella sp. 332]
MSFAIQVTNIAATSSEKAVHDFFSFCGTINKIDFNDTPPKTATIFFERVSAAKTALMLNGGALDGSNLTVTSNEVRPDHEEEVPMASGSSGEHHLHQEDKPRSGIAAEYLARGYVLSDGILQKAIELDQKNGISTRFLSYLKTVDQTLGAKLGGPEPTLSEKAINKAKTLDQQQGISTKAFNYYQAALQSPVGKQVGQNGGLSVWSFYSSTSKQVMDIHEEARRIAETHKNAGTTPAPVAASATSPVQPTGASAATAPSM